MALFLFRKPIERFLDRANKIGKGGVEASQQKQERLEKVGPSAADEFMRLLDNALLVEREDWIQGELERISGPDQTQRERVLIRLIAAQSIVQQFENKYRVIRAASLTP